MKEKVVIAIVKGGLGNQLFIYAAARALALRTNRKLYLDKIRGYSADTYERKFRLSNFPHCAEIMPESWRIAPSLRHLKHKIIRAINKALPRNYRNYYAEQHAMGAEQLIELEPQLPRITLHGYFQDEEYFSDYAATIRQELLPPSPPKDSANELLGERISKAQSVFIHFRRIRYRHRLTKDYYQEAIYQACDELNDPVFVLFGDDIHELSDQLDFRGKETIAVTENGDNELMDLWLMSRCKHAIIANSSFSWWGAWLGEPASEKRKVWSPANFGFAIHPARNWITIANEIESA